MQKADIRLLVLHEDELRNAAKMLQLALAAEGTEQFSDAALQALNACIVALYGMHDEDKYPVAMVSSTRRLLGKNGKPKRVKLPLAT